MREYLNAWLPIMLMSNERVLFIDAFAGPGEYSGGQQGSPIIALEAFLQHESRSLMNGRIDYKFIEKEPDRKLHLDSVIAKYEPNLPQNCSVEVIEGTFTTQLSGVLNAIDRQDARLSPSFVMVDPFGVSDTPMSLIRRILKNEKSEVYVTFMYEYIQRFVRTPEFRVGLDSQFGTDSWQEGIEIEDTVQRRNFFFNLYISQLKKSAKYVLHFDVYRGNSLVYALFFASNSERGCDKMKSAMWKVSPMDGLNFTGGTHDQLFLGPEIVDYSALSGDLLRQFRKNRILGIEDLEHFMCTDKTVFHSGQLRSELANMEDAGALSVDEQTRNRRRSYPPGTRLMFVNPPPPEPQQGSLRI